MRIIKINIIILVVWVIACIVFPFSACAQKAGRDKPNIIVITTDQQFAGAMSFIMGHRWLNTPNLDKLAAQGVVFSNAYVANPLCAPSRNSILTGQYPHVTKIQDNDIQNKFYKNKKYFEEKDFKSLGNYFRDAGYETAYFGKWHINFNPKDKVANGFDVIKYATGRGKDDSLPNLVDRYLKHQHKKPILLFLSFLNPHDVAEWSRFQFLKNGSIGKMPQKDDLPPLFCNAKPPVNESGTMSIMRESYHHNLRLFPVGNYTDYDWRRLRWGYYRLVEKVDSLIGETLSVINENGYDKNTVLLFTSDHGSAVGAHQFVQKTVFYDESSRVPFILKFGSKLNPSFNNTLVNTGVDILPTLLDFAGIEVPDNLPGKSLKPAAEKDEILPVPYIAVENKMNQGGSVNGVIPVANGRMIRSMRYKYSLFDIGNRREELYDLWADPHEMINIAYDKKAQPVIKKMRSDLLEWAKKYKDSVAVNMIKFMTTNHTIKVSNNKEIYKALNTLKPGDTLSINDGIYKDLKLVVKRSGLPGNFIYIKAAHPGKVFFTGDCKVELRGGFLVLNGIFFKDGSRKFSEWKPHGPGLVAIYGSHNRVTQCAFDDFDEANSAWITASIPGNGKVPQYNRIDHCSFTNKVTFDQVINLNNSIWHKGKTGGSPMYNRVDHCFFSNPKKPGNAGGGIRVGYLRRDTGRCLIDSNLFMRQDSEAEIITSKSQENIYYANTFLNCRGTLNFRHGDHQIAINNFFISTDKKFGYGGMFVWGSKHVIANNYFNLTKTIDDRGNAAIYLNPGAENSAHALAFDMLIANNYFKNINGYAINFTPLTGRRKAFCKKYGLTYQDVYDITLKNNVFYSNISSSFPFFKDTLKGNDHDNIWVDNELSGKRLGIGIQKGMLVGNFYPVNNSYSPQLSIKYNISTDNNVPDISGISMNINALINKGIVGRPLTIKAVGPSWMKAIPDAYAYSGKLPSAIQSKLNSVIKRKNNKR